MQQGRLTRGVIQGLGIRHVGAATAVTLAAEFGSLDALAGADEDRLLAVPDVGPEVAAAILNWFANEKNRRLLEKLKRHGIDPKEAVRPAAAPASGPLAGKTVVVTGELASMTRQAAEQRIRRAGGKPTRSVSKNTDFLVAGSEPGAGKMRSAEKHATPILDEDAFLRLLGEP